MKKSEDIEKIKEKLLPILSKAAIGEYSKDIKLEKNDPMNVIYGGIQVLINTIREQAAELEVLTKPTRKHFTVSQTKLQNARLSKLISKKR